MLSGNGRHRRPRQAPALLVAAGVTGSAIAIPLLGAGAANAADGDTWDRVAECESGGSWSQNTGNGYYGGLQLTQDDWENYGGLEFAPSADAASRNQQITVAERILADQGVGKWRACGLLTGLNQDTVSPNVDPGVPTDDDRDDSLLGLGGTGTSSGSADSGDSSASSSPSATSGSSGSSGKATSDAGAGASCPPPPPLKVTSRTSRGRVPVLRPSPRTAARAATAVPVRRRARRPTPGPRRPAGTPRAPRTRPPVSTTTATPSRPATVWPPSPTPLP